MIRARLLLAAVAAVGLAGPAAVGQTGASAPRYVKVEAPLAQQLILAAKAAHPELKKIGLHAVPPDGTESAIIANAIPSKIGKVSSANDLVVVTTQEPRVYPHAEEGGFFDLGLPMGDAQGRPVGMMVMEIPYKDAATREAALAMGLRIRDEVAAKIPSKQALFEAAR